MDDATLPDITITGLVESLAGGYLSGWAIDPAQDTPCSIQVLDADDATVATGTADRPRADLAAYAFGRIDFAFRLPIPSLGQSPLLRVLADGAELAGSPLPTGTGHYDGAVSVNDGWAEGWVHERRLGFAPPRITLFDQDNICVGEGQSLRSDADPLFTPARFRIRLHPLCFTTPELGLRAEADGTAFATTRIALRLQGFLDEITDTNCSGWLSCPEAPSVSFEIELRRNGVLVGSTPATLPRGDLRDILPRSWQSGFVFTRRPLNRTDDQPSLLSLRIAGSDTELFDGPFLVATPRVLIGSARRLARLAHTSPALDPVGRSVLQSALACYIAQQREAAVPVPGKPATPGRRLRASTQPAAADTPRLSVVIPIYRDVPITTACIDSVLAHRDPAHRIVLINDASPEPDMADALDVYAGYPNVFVLTNPINRGFIQSCNRGLDFCRQGDVVLLNSDTLVFAGGLAELQAAAHAASEIGTATALSNNATIFSYPYCNQPTEQLDDMGWDEIAAAALAANRGLVIDVPTAHGFCMLLRRELLDRVGTLDEAFGRGYGEENDLCLRAFDLGFAHVAAGGVLVLHRESVSFTDEKDALLRTNLQLLERRFPEYGADIRDFLQRDDLRRARWGIDTIRLRRATALGARYVLVLRNWLQGGTQKAIDDIAASVGYGTAAVLDLCVGLDGTVRLACPAPLLEAVFAPGEHAAMFALLDGVAIETVLIHQLLGHTEGFIAAFTAWSRPLRRLFYLHDYYPVCPRVTMIDAVDRFCDVAPVEICIRCVALAGAHDADRMDNTTPPQHRALFHDLLAGMDDIVVPSAAAAAYLGRAFPDLRATIVPHPEPVAAYEAAAAGSLTPDIVLFGAIGPHKGSARLLDIARRARLAAPALRFHVIGYTDIDPELRDCGNVWITGAYQPGQLPELVAATGARLALFLHGWPETFSYTLSEAVQLGLVPLVPDIGAPAERVRRAGYGHVFGFPIDSGEVLRLLADLTEARLELAPAGAGPANFATAAHGYAKGAQYPVAP